MGVAGCSASSGSPSPDPQAGESTSTPPTSAKKDPKAKLEHPKDLAAVADPCKLLTPEQVSALGTSASPEKISNLVGGARCRWSGPELAINITPDTIHNRGVAEVIKDQGSSSNFETAQVGEYPAVYKDRQSLMCRVEVGVSDTESFAVNFSRGGAKDPEMMDACAYGGKIATEVLKNIPDAQAK